MRIINTEKEDYHIHSINFSDGWSTIDEIVKYSGEIGMTKIAICDHSKALLDNDKFPRKVYRSPIKRWENVFNKVEVIFGVEADIINIGGDICAYIDRDIEETFIILSYHQGLFKAESKDISKAFIKAIQKNHDKINIIGHVCEGLDEADAKKVILEANKHNIPLELNAKYFLRSPEKWDVLLKTADRLYINSDAHILKDLRDLRTESFNLLRELKYIQ